MVKEILTDVDMLHQRADEVDLDKEKDFAKQIVEDLMDTMRYHNLKSLSAPQIGYGKRIFVISYNGVFKNYMNPMVHSAKGLELSREECSSIPGKTYLIPRRNQLEVAYQVSNGDKKISSFVGVAALVFQHENNHLDGILLNDLGLEIDDKYDVASEEEKLEVVNAYLEYLNELDKKLQEEVENDPDAKAINEDINKLIEEKLGKPTYLKK